ncbi:MULTISPECIES: glycosyltransferase [Microbacterium]|uniref:glycosyltransferase n=1 Tax=Microbacterium TaxID=33882 RepID=UPI000D65C8E9|nr:MULTISPECIES: glycosyltransferase [Microbacterium]
MNSAPPPPEALLAVELKPLPHEVSVVVPVYQGERTLQALVEEIEPLTRGPKTPDGTPWRVTEVLLVHDNGPDRSDERIRELASRYPFVRPVWLSRNFGQHAATLAGIASSGSEWIVTLDEDGQHDPRSIGVLLDVAQRERAPLVYAQASNEPPHGALRNASSRGAKKIVSLLTGDSRTTQYQSFRLILGELGRSIAAYATGGVYLDVALSWGASSVASASVPMRIEGRERSGYSPRKLMSHFWRLVLSTGTRSLRFVGVLGIVSGVVGILLAIWFGLQHLFGLDSPDGWTSLMCVILVGAGAILFALGVISEYLGAAVNMAMGKPTYLIVSDPASGPLGRVVRR